MAPPTRVAEEQWPKARLDRVRAESTEHGWHEMYAEEVVVGD
jgi:hypothetical protein